MRKGRLGDPPGVGRTMRNGAGMADRVLRCAEAIAKISMVQLAISCGSVVQTFVLPLQPWLELNQERTHVLRDLKWPLGQALHGVGRAPMAAAMVQPALAAHPGLRPCIRLPPHTRPSDFDYNAFDPTASNLSLGLKLLAMEQQ